MPDLMSLAPAMLQPGQRRVEKDPPPIRNVQHLQRGFPDRVDEKHRPPVDLDPRYANSADGLSQDARIVRLVMAEIELKRFADILKPKRGSG